MITPNQGLIRSWTEKVTRGTSFRRTLPATVGGSQIYVSGSAGLKYLFRRMHSVDPGLCRLAQEFVQPGSTVWDVGANIGLFSFAAAHLSGNFGSVVAYEPDAWLVQLLRRSAGIQPRTSAPVQIVPAAVANACELRTFNIASRSRASNALHGYGHSQAGAIAEQQTVMSVSLDWMTERLPVPNVVKIDVEGAELEVLRGAMGLLRQSGPAIICEVGSENSREVGELLRSFGYRIFDGDAMPDERQELVRAPWNTVAVRRLCLTDC